MRKETEIKIGIISEDTSQEQMQAQRKKLVELCESLTLRMSAIVIKVLALYQ